MAILKQWLGKLALVIWVVGPGALGPVQARDEATTTPARPRTDHETARRALSKGEIRPLDSVIADVRRTVPGDIVGVELDKQHGRWTYRIKVITPAGRMKRVQIDARAAAPAAQGSGEPVGPPRGVGKPPPAPLPGPAREPPPPVVKGAPVQKPAKPAGS